MVRKRRRGREVEREEEGRANFHERFPYAKPRVSVIFLSDLTQQFPLQGVIQGQGWLGTCPCSHL